MHMPITRHAYASDRVRRRVDREGVRGIFKGVAPGSHCSCGFPKTSTAGRPACSIRGSASTCYNSRILERQRVGQGPTPSEPLVLTRGLERRGCSHRDPAGRRAELIISCRQAFVLPLLPRRRHSAVHASQRTLDSPVIDSGMYRFMRYRQKKKRNQVCV